MNLGASWCPILHGSWDRQDRWTNAFPFASSSSHVHDRSLLRWHAEACAGAFLGSNARHGPSESRRTLDVESGATACGPSGLNVFSRVWGRVSSHISDILPAALSPLHGA